MHDPDLTRSKARPMTAAPHKAAAAHSLRLMLILSALMSFSSIATDLYLPALPTLVRELHTNSGRVELTISTFLIGFSSASCSGGR